MTVCLHKNIGYSRQQRFYDLLCPLQSVLDSSGEHGQDVERGVLLITCNIQIFQWAHWPLLSRERLRAISLCSNVVQMDGRFDCSFGGIMFLLASPFEGCVFDAILRKVVLFIRVHMTITFASTLRCSQLAVRLSRKCMARVAIKFDSVTQMFSEDRARDYS